MTEPDPEFYTAAEAAIALRISKKTLFNWIRAGRVSAVRLNDQYRSWRIPRSNIDGKPTPEPSACKSALDRAASRYESVRWSDDRGQRDSAEAVLLALLQVHKVVHHYHGQAYWSQDGELHRTHSRSFRSQTK